MLKAKHAENQGFAGSVGEFTLMHMCVFLCIACSPAVLLHCQIVVLLFSASAGYDSD